ncbi:GAL11 [Candida pseudojiufengensis]|uniref:GAL11 n=1 Tax=Candida pseudojiufengensis TaxID=497109 RepID=UPI00222529A1|nr:GAL11 [Candida pseudojiufengensis]KAI5963650.1 GAL11 [Candida pseudojiufengensis]
MNLNNVSQGVPNGSTPWQGMYTGEERQRVVSIIMDTLSDLHGTNPNFDFQKLTKMAQDFEKIVYEKSPSRDDYLKAIKSKVNQLRMQKQQLGGGSGPTNTSQQQQPPQVVRNTTGNMSPMNAQNMQFLQQQAQVRSQSQAQIQARQQQLRQMVNQQQGPQQIQQTQQSQAAMNPTQGKQQQQPQSQQRPQQSQQQVPQNQRGNVSQRPQQQQQQQQQQTGPTMGENNTLGTANQQVPPQLLQLIRSTPIPMPLLSKIPNLPKGVSTWNQIFDCIRKKIISQDMLPLIKDIHSTHMQLVMRQQQQKLNMRYDGTAPNGKPSDNKVNMVNQGVNGVNLNNMNPKQREMFLENQRLAAQKEGFNTVQQNQGGIRRASTQTQAQPPLPQQIPQGTPNISQPPMHQQPQQPPHPQIQQPIQQNQTQSQIPSQMSQQKPPQFQITQQDFAKYSNEALSVLNRLQQQKQIDTQLDPTMKETFIRKYILHQKNQLWKQQQQQQQQQRQLQQQQQQQQQHSQQQHQPQHQQLPPHSHQQSQSQMGSQNNATGLGISSLPPNQPSHLGQVPQANPALQPNQIPQQQVRQQQNVPVQMQQKGAVPPPMANMPHASPLLNNSVPATQLKPNAVQNNLSSPLMNQRGATAVVENMPNNNLGGRPNTAPANVSVASLLPPLTDEAKLRLRQLIEDVSKNNVLLKDVTTLLSPTDKSNVREAMSRIQEQYGNVDSIISYFFLLTKNAEGTKRLIQMKYMTKNILDNLHRGIYLAAPDLLEKLKSQYAKYFDYVKEQINLRRQQLSANSSIVPPQQHVQPPISSQQQQQMRRAPAPQQHSMMADQNNRANQAFLSQNPQSSPQMYQTPINQPPNAIPQQHPPQIQAQQQQQPLVGNQMSMSPNWIPNQNQIPPQMQQQLPQVQQQQPPIQQIPPQRNSISQPKTKKAAPKKKRTSSNAAAATPNALASSIKTPHNIATPSLQSSGQSPPMKTTPSASGTTPKINGINTASSIANINQPPKNVLDAPEIDIFSVSNDSIKRRELSLTDPRQFFIESLKKLLDIDENGECSIKSAATLQAISSSFKQVREINEVCLDNLF